jgi:hypothetical protein
LLLVDACAVTTAVTTGAAIPHAQQDDRLTWTCDLFVPNKVRFHARPDDSDDPELVARRDPVDGRGHGIHVSPSLCPGSRGGRPSDSMDGARRC